MEEWEKHTCMTDGNPCRGPRCRNYDDMPCFWDKEAQDMEMKRLIKDIEEAEEQANEDIRGCK